MFSKAKDRYDKPTKPNRLTQEKQIIWLQKINIVFFVLSSLSLILTLTMQFGNFTIIPSRGGSEKIVPSVVYIPLYIFLLICIITALTGSFALQRRGRLGIGLYVGLLFFTGITGLVLFLVISIFKEYMLEAFEEYYLSLLTDTPFEWESIQNRLNCCGTTEETLLTSDTLINSLLSGEACREFINNMVFLQIIEQLRLFENETSGLAEAGFMIDFCIDGIAMLYDKLWYAILSLVSTNIVIIVCQLFVVKKLIAPDVSHERTNTDIDRPMRSNQTSLHDKDLLDVGVGHMRVKSLRPELKNIYTDSYRMASKKHRKKSRNTILKKNLIKFEQEEENESLKRINLVDTENFRNTARKVSLTTFPGISKKERGDSTGVRLKFRSSTNETLDRINNEEDIVANGNTLDDSTITLEVDEVRATNISFL